MCTLKKPDDERRAVRLLSDRPISDDSDDRLGHGAIADAFADLIDDPGTQTPLTMAVTARWGAGKTSFVKLVRQRLGVVHSWRRPHLVCEFNAWLHEDAPNPGVALASAVAQTVNRHRPLWRRLTTPVSVRMLSAQARWTRVAARAVGASVLAIIAVFLPATREAVTILAASASPVKPVAEAALRSPLIAAAVLAGLMWLVATKVFAASTALSRFFADPRDEAAAGAMHEVRGELGMLVKQALRGRNRLVIVVDDLDRCSGERALSICQVAAKLLDHRGVVAVFVGDVEHLAAAAARRTGAAGPDSAIQEGKRYLEKLIQVELSLPAVHWADIRGMVKATGAELPKEAKQATWQLVTTRLLDLVRAISPWRVAVNLVGAAVSFTFVFVFRLMIATVPSTLMTAATLVIMVVGLVAFMGKISLGMAITVTLGCVIVVVLGVFAVVGAMGTWVGSADIPEAIRFAAVISVPVVIAGFRPIPGAWVQRKSGAITAEIQIASREGATTDEIEQRLISRFGTTETMRRRIDRFIAEESEAARQANEAILPFLPDNPRTAKRIVSKLRLLLVIASGRGLLDAGSAVTIEHLVKWVALLERWPAFARASMAEPGLLVATESMAYIDLGTALATHVDGEGEARELRAFLTEGSPLAPVLDHLIHLTAVRTQVSRDCTV